MAERRPHVLMAHGHERVDDYYWLRDDDRSDPDVLAYLEAENAYTEKALAPLRPLRDRLFEELKGRIRQDDDSVPYRDGDWYYQTRYRRGLEYPLYYRRRAEEGASEALMLDLNELAKPHDYYEIGALAMSENGRRLAFTEDSVSREEYVVRVKDLETGRLLDDAIPDCAEPLAWANDHRTLFYVRRQPGTLIPYRVFRHVLGSDPATDVLVYEETDERYGLDLGKSRDGRWIVIHAEQTLSDEFLLIDADRPTAQPTVVLPRRDGHEHDIEPVGERLFLLSNLDAPNFRLIEAPLSAAADTSQWRELVPHREDVLLEDFAGFSGHIVVNERVGGLLRLRVLDRSGGPERSVGTATEAATSQIDVNPEVRTTSLRYSTTSLATPDTIVDFDMATGERRILKIEEIPGGYDPEDYVAEIRYAPARDGASVPVSLLYRRDLPTDRPHPLIQVGYGAYGASYDPEFNSNRLSLVDRGMVFALAHIRGGQERGRRWYDEGRLLNKMNSFTDFIDVTDFLVEEGLADPDRVVAVGRSAGGLLMAAIANLRPDLYSLIVAGVPFVDVVTDMLDPSIPLVTFEYDEWGDPARREFYDYMLAYSPYDQVAARDYPALLVTAGLYDSRVQYWEPAKWVARLRALKTDDEPLYLKTNMQAGHFDASGRFEHLKETALEYAVILDRVGLADTDVAE